MDSSGDHRPAQQFPSPLELAAACDGWEEMYPSHVLFAEDRRAFDEGRFWFQDALHYPEPLKPFDATTIEYAVVALNQASARLFVVPASLGIEYRLLNGYVYFSANAVSDEATLGRRGQLFRQRGGHYYAHWDELYERWCKKVEKTTSELRALDVPRLPEVEDESVVTSGRGWGSSHALLTGWDRLLEGIDGVLQYHFELLNLGYGAYLVFYELCRESFPDIPDQSIAGMIAGGELLLLRPDRELRRLAELAAELGVADALQAVGDEDALRAALGTSKAGQRWIADFEQTKEPWFYFSYGNGLYSHHRSWVDDTSLPISMIGSYAARLAAGEDISPPGEELTGERDRIAGEYRSLLPEDARASFDQALALARTVFPYVENHNLYIDHRYFAIFWNKVREFGSLLAEHGFLEDAEDVFCLRQDEVRCALDELRLWWSAGYAGVPRGPLRWPEVVARRKAMLEAMSRWPAPPAVGRDPGEITDPITVMLWGITTARVRDWLAPAGTTGTLTGVAGSPGTAQGPARVILSPADLDGLEDGEVLVAPSTSTSWTPLFGRIAAAVSDIGGIMCHAAIVAREYGLPAVVGAAGATAAIQTGDLVRVDGDTGVVTILG